MSLNLEDCQGTSGSIEIVAELEVCPSLQRQDWGYESSTGTTSQTKRRVSNWPGFEGRLYLICTVVVNKFSSSFLSGEVGSLLSQYVSLASIDPNCVKCFIFPTINAKFTIGKLQNAFHGCTRATKEGQQAPGRARCGPEI